MCNQSALACSLASSLALSNSFLFLITALPCFYLALSSISASTFAAASS
nr:MAG TPA: hypothetical protein [Crassvirales sp.]